MTRSSPTAACSLKQQRVFQRQGQFTFEADALKHPDLEAATLYLFLIEIHTGNVFHPRFRWVSDAPR